MSRRIAFALAAISALLFVGLLSSRLWIRFYRIPTSGMEPTLPIGSHIVVRLGGEVLRGSILVHRSTMNARISMVKRVVAADGDLVEIRDKRLFVNGKEAIEPYAVHDDPQVYRNRDMLPEPYRSRDNFGPHRVAPGHYFVLGDNRDRSSDSRYWGTVPRENVIGPVVLAFSTKRGVWRP